MYSNSSLYIGRVALKTIHLYFTVIHSIYINYVLPVTVFENASLCYILDGATSLNLSLKEAILKLLILYNILAKIIINSNLILKANIDATFCLTFVGYLCISEISYINKQRSKLSFTATKAARLNIQFSPFRDHLTFYLKWSKTNKNKQGV
jgi:hypothetical protein